MTELISPSDLPAYVFECATILTTISVYWVVRQLYLKSGLNPLLQPVLLGSAIMIILLILLDIPYPEYFDSVALIHWFLAPSIIALAIPLFYESRHMRLVLHKLIIAICLGGILTVAMAVAVLILSGASDDSINAMLTKSVTTAVAVLVSEETGAIASLAAGFVMITGVLGAVVAPLLFKLTNCEKDEEKGLALGLSAHAIGTVKAFEISSKCGAYSILAMIVNGIFTAIFLPICIWLL